MLIIDGARGLWASGPSQEAVQPLKSVGVGPLPESGPTAPQEMLCRLKRTALKETRLNPLGFKHFFQ